MPTAEEQLLDDVHMTCGELDVNPDLKIASRARGPIGGAYHGLTPCKDRFRMLNAIPKARDGPSDRVVLRLQRNASSYPHLDTASGQFFC